jgi:hypothetical protein
VVATSAEQTAIAIRESSPAIIAPRTFSEMLDLADRLSKSNLLSAELRNKPADVLMQIMAGQELGLHAIVSMSSFSIINGKPVLDAKTAVALVLASGKCEYFRRVEAVEGKVTYATKRKGEPEQRCTWTIDMAKKAALHQKDNWRTFERQMLAARAKSELANDVYPDVLKGIGIREEIMDRDGVIDAEFVDMPAADQETTIDAPEVLAIDDMQTVEALKAQGLLVAQLKLTGSTAERANGRYKARMAWLKSQPAAASAPEPAA